MLFAHTLWSPAADPRLLHLRMFASATNFQPQASSSGFGSPVVPQCRRPGMPDAAAASRDPGRITGDSTGVQGPDFQPPEPPSPLECTVTKNAPTTPLQSTVTKSLDLKCPRINSYKKYRGPPPACSLPNSLCLGSCPSDHGCQTSGSQARILEAFSIGPELVS